MCQRQKNQQRTLTTHGHRRRMCEHTLMKWICLNWKRFCWPMILKRRLKNNWLSMEKTEKTDCSVTILAAAVGLGCAPSGVGHKAAKLFVIFLNTMRTVFPVIL